MKLKNFKPRDIIAALVITGLILFKLTGHNGTLDTAVAIILGYYFAQKDSHPVVVKKDDLPTE